MEYYFERYGDLDLQRRMVADRSRTRAFARALEETVRPGDLVLDVGTGTGILAMLAARAGARHVFAIDQSNIAETAARLVRRNGLQDRVTVLKGSASDLVLEGGPVDLLVSECLGNMALVEGMIQDVLIAKDKNLAPGGRIIPSRISVIIAPIDDPNLYVYEGPGFWRRPIQDLDFTSLETEELRQGRTLQIRVEPPALIAEGQSIGDFDLLGASSNDMGREGQLTFTSRRHAVLNGFVGWFRAELSPGVVLDTGPEEPETHWAQTYMAFRPRIIREGESITVGYRMRQDPDEARHLRLELVVGEDEQSFVIE